MRSLAQFSTYQEVFKNTTALPAFFDTNLVDPGRVVKAFLNDPQAHIRIFYYQYLRLCFQLETPKSETYVQKLEELINNPTFNFIFYQDDDPTIYNDSNAKGLISQFFQLLGTGDHTVLEAVNNNPIMDVILVHFFRTLMILTNQTQALDNYIPKEQLIDYLCNFFGVEVQFHGECCHYVESDIFVYEENEAAVYMAYISPYDVQSHYQSQHVQSKEQIIVAPLQPPPVPAQSKYQPSPVQPPKYQPIADQLKYQSIAAQPKYQPTAAQPKYQSISAQPKYQAPAPVVVAASETSWQAAKPVTQKVPTGKQSYIASEFVDYTHTSQKLESKVTTNLKGSDTYISSKYQAKASSYNQYTSSNVEQPFANANIKPMAFVETASISSGSDNKNLSEYIHQVGGLPDYLTKSNPITRPPVTHLQFQEISASNSPSPAHLKPLTPTPVSTYQPAATQPIPTKDYAPITTASYQTSQFGIQSSQYATQNNQFSSQTNQFGTQSNQNSQSSTQNQFNYSKVESSLPLKPVSSTLSDPKKDIYYNPKVQNPSYNQFAYSNTSKTETFDYKSSAAQVANGKSPAAVAGGTGKKKPFGLNVSEQFTNSLTMKSMSQPFKSSVQNMKSRARNFRASLVNVIK